MLHRDCVCVYLNIYINTDVCVYINVSINIFHILNSHICKHTSICGYMYANYI